MFDPVARRVERLEGLLGPLASRVFPGIVLVVPLVLVEQVLDLSFDLVPFLFEFIENARPLLRGIGRHLAAIDRNEFIAE